MNNKNDSNLSDQFVAENDDRNNLDMNFIEEDDSNVEGEKNTTVQEINEKINETVVKTI